MMPGVGNRPAGRPTSARARSMSLSVMPRQEQMIMPSPSCYQSRDTACANRRQSATCLHAWSRGSKPRTGERSRTLSASCSPCAPALARRPATRQRPSSVLGPVLILREVCSGHPGRSRRLAWLAVVRAWAPHGGHGRRCGLAQAANARLAHFLKGSQQLSSFSLMASREAGGRMAAALPQAARAEVAAVSADHDAGTATPW